MVATKEEQHLWRSLATVFPAAEALLQFVPFFSSFHRSRVSFNVFKSNDRVHKAPRNFMTAWNDLCMTIRFRAKMVRPKVHFAFYFLVSRNENVMTHWTTMYVGVPPKLYYYCRHFRKSRQQETFYCCTWKYSTKKVTWHRCHYRNDEDPRKPRTPWPWSREPTKRATRSSFQDS